MMKFNQFTSFILVVFLGSFVFSCGQMTAKDDGLDSKTIEEASGTSGETENSSDGSGEDSGLDNSTDNTTSSTAGFTIGTISGNNTESGGTATFTVKLNTQPSADVLIAVSSSDTTEGTVRPSSLSFTSSNYNSAQTVTVTGIDDSAVDGNKNFRIILAAASSSDSNYNGLNPDDVSVTNTDDETAGFTISSISENTTEAGGTATFTTKLNSQPSADVSIAVSSSDTTEGTVNPLSLTFTNSNWSADQTVTVTGVDDSATDGNQSYTVILAAATSSDSNYNGLNPTDVSVTNIDNEWSGIKQFGTSEWDRGNGLGLDPSGNVYVAGQTSGGLDGNVNTGLGDIFLVKYNSSGTKQWTKQLGTSATEEVTGASVDSGGNVYITGYTRGGLDGNTSAGNKDIFLLKYNSSGVKQWTKQIGTSSDDGGQGVAIDSNGNIYVTGYTYGGLDGNTNLGSYDVILLKYNSSGTKQWTQQLGTSSGDIGYDIEVDSIGDIYVSGQTQGAFDGNTNSGGLDAFIVKYNSSGVMQ